MSTPVAGDFPTVFYSWQSDLPKEVCRNFIKDALKRALTQLGRENAISQDPRIDRDTKHEPGSPDIVKIIERKIELSKAFVGDVSLVAKSVDGRDKWLPNASVATETGYALASLGERRVVLPFNTAFGDPNDLPFDLRNRRVLRYELAPRHEGELDEDWVQRRMPVRTALVASLVDALRAIFEKAADSIPPTVLERHAQMLDQQRALEERVRPRSLAAEHELILARHLKRVVGGTPAIGIAAGAFDAEADTYASAIASCCTASGWNAHKNQLLLASISGLAVAVVRPEALPGEAIALMDAFRELGIACPAVAYSKVQNQIGFDLDKSPEGTVLLVGKKP